MFRHTSLPVWLLTILSVFVSSDGFLWIGGGGGARKVSSERSQPPLMPQQYLYRGEASGWTPQYTYDNPPMTVAVPFALPVPAQSSDDVVVVESAIQTNPNECIYVPPTSQYFQESSSGSVQSLRSSYMQMGGGMKGIPPTVQLVPCLCPISRDEVQQQQQQQQQQQIQQASYVVQQPQQQQQPAPTQ